MTIDSDDEALKNLHCCPFCEAGGEVSVTSQHLAPRMSGPGALISVTIRHWCPKGPGCVQAYREVRGRDYDSAVAQYNKRPGLQHE